jgi:Tol biopolymer transport system component
MVQSDSSDEQCRQHGLPLHRHLKQKLGRMKFLVFGLTAALGLVILFWQTPSAQAQVGQAYTVQRDDTLWRLAEKYLGDGWLYQEIIIATQARHAADPEFAALSDPNLLYVGDHLWIPGGVSPPTDGDSASGQETPITPELRVNVEQGPDSPTGEIAFSFWNDAPGRCTYEINVIDAADCLASSTACQSSRRIFALNNASEPALSPEGTRLAFRGWGAIPEKYNDQKQDHPYYGCATPQADRMLGQTSLDGTEYVRVTGYWEDSHPDWAPNGERLIFDTTRLGDGITRIMTASADGQREETLRIAGQQPSWAPDSDRFVYRGCDITGNRCGLWLARALPVEAWDLGVNMTGPILEEPEAAHPDWSPVGDQVVYQSPVGGSWDLYIINIDGTGKRQLTSEPGIEGLPVWSPDGQWVAYLSDNGGNWGIWLIRADGTDQAQLFSFDGGIFSPLPVPPYGSRSWLDEQLSWSP